MSNATQPYSGSKATHVYNIAGSLQVTVNEKDNPFELPISSLFHMAARNNPKRSFLFVSKLLGKHIPIDPHTSLLAGYALAVLLCRHLQPERSAEWEPLLQQTMKGLTDPAEAASVYRKLIADRLQVSVPLKLLGFAETATALGHAMFDAFESAATYLHTTRELLADRESVLQFDEEHSHAVAHRCYAERSDYWANDEIVVFVDDEMTTGKTTLNLIRDMHAKFPRKRYVVASLLDWRSVAAEDAFAALESEFGITIETICLYRGTIEVSGEAFPNGAPQGLLNSSAADSDEIGNDRTGRPEYRVHTLESVFEPVEAVSLDLAGSSNAAPYMKQTGRFGIAAEERGHAEAAIQRAAAQLEKLRTDSGGGGGGGGGKTLVIGTGEFMYVPMQMAAALKGSVYYQSSTRSPIHPVDRADYAVKDGVTFASPDDEGVRHFLYNLGAHTYDDVFVVLERVTPMERLEPMLEALKYIDCKTIHVVCCTGEPELGERPASKQKKPDQRAASRDPRVAKLFERTMKPPVPLGSYDAADVTFLLKDLRDAKLEVPTEDREEAIQSGVHYSEMLPKEYEPSERYLELYRKTLDESAALVAGGIAAVAELIVRKRGLNCVLVSLARAGTPVGVLIKRYIEQRYGVSLPHYSISIIRGKGIDENALLYILQQHGVEASIQFVDGWTGKGAIRRTLMEACRQFEDKYGVRLSDDLAVLADPGRCSETFGTREDYLVPSACLNATVSGLMSRTVLKPGLIGSDDYHGSKFYEQWLSIDESKRFVDRIAAHFEAIAQTAVGCADGHAQAESPEATWQGLADIQAVQQAFGIEDINLIKPGVGETCRVLLRRVPWKILVNRMDNPHLGPILMLAEERGVPVEVFPGLAYSCCGIIKPLKGESA
ncbi:RNA binding Pelota-like protein [Paenibacillus cellulosilyticus]|uniref:RNA binding Pelota-like protein n=2 Tax=Paenibacillus cellulosilyticus TaxID=375489 RepID=A0A2V2YVD4_9BACL|nr:RNA binding Pelota-like protein [Paenibacillus cellulosilyticus]